MLKKSQLPVIFILGLIFFGLMSSGGGPGCNSSCDSGRSRDTNKTLEIADALQASQPTPTDLEYSLERYNLIRRAYWINGQRERARMLPSPVRDTPLGYVILFTQSGAVVGKFVVEGKITSLNSFLTPDSRYYGSRGDNEWLADVDGTYGTYGTNDTGIFFFTPDGKYLEWNGIYLYSDIPLEIENPVLKVNDEKTN